MVTLACKSRIIEISQLIDGWRIVILGCRFDVPERCRLILVETNTLLAKQSKVEFSLIIILVDSQYFSENIRCLGHTPVIRQFIPDNG
jgi:hypothetical protein